MKWPAAIARLIAVTRAERTVSTLSVSGPVDCFAAGICATFTLTWPLAGADLVQSRDALAASAHVLPDGTGKMSIFIVVMSSTKLPVVALRPHRREL